jgi:hypothetical protein
VVNVVLAGPLSGEIGAGALENVLKRKRKRRSWSEEDLRRRSNGTVSEGRSGIDKSGGNKRREQAERTSEGNNHEKQRIAMDEELLKQKG